MALRLASLCTILLLPNFAFAAPADQPAVQDPTETAEPNTTAPKADEESVTEDTATADEVTETPDPAPDDTATVTTADGPDAEAKPDTEAPDEGTGETVSGALPTYDEDPDKKDLSNLLVSDEPEAAPRARVSRSAQPARVDRDERLRNYYARIYRPEHNPARIHFAARGAYALAGTNEGTGGGRMGFANVELGQTWNFIGYGIGAALYAGGLTFGENGVERFGGILVGGGPSLGIGRLGLLGRGYLDPRIGYSFFYAPVSTTRVGMVDPPDAAPHGPKIQIDAGLLLHGSERRRFRHGIGVSLGWQILVHSFAGDYPIVNSFNIGFGYFFG